MSNPDNAKPTHDPDLYARMSRSKDTSAFHDACRGFFADMRAVREKHGLQNVVCLIAHPVVNDATGHDEHMLLVQSMGDSGAVPVLLAAALGAVRGKREAALDELAGSKRTPRRTKAR